MRTETRLWRTEDGRLVADGDPDAATLAYAAGDDIATGDEAKISSATQGDAAEAKARRPVANKAAGKPADK